MSTSKKASPKNGRDCCRKLKRKRRTMGDRVVFFVLTLISSVSFGIILPLVLGIKSLVLIAIGFSVVWFIYAVALYG